MHINGWVKYGAPPAYSRRQNVKVVHYGMLIEVLEILLTTRESEAILHLKEWQQVGVDDGELFVLQKHNTVFVKKHEVRRVLDVQVNFDDVNKQVINVWYDGKRV